MKNERNLSVVSFVSIDGSTKYTEYFLAAAIATKILVTLKMNIIAENNEK